MQRRLVVALRHAYLWRNIERLRVLSIVIYHLLPNNNLAVITITFISTLFVNTIASLSICNNVTACWWSQVSFYDVF
jgi:hypothetical protein